MNAPRSEAELRDAIGPRLHDRPRRGGRDMAGAAERRLEAPHRRRARGSRLLERTTVLAYRSATALVARVPPAPARALIATGAQASYLLWPAKRRWSNANFGHVLGLPPDHPQVRRLALAAYRTYARYLVELMRLPSMSREEGERMLAPHAIDTVEELIRAPGGLILAAAHVGNNEAVALGIASRGWPISVLADDSSFPEMFELLRRQREAWGVRIVPWRNIRQIYGVLRRGEALGLLVDWGYRSDGIPVRLFDAWTTLPAGPALLAAKTGAKILPVTIRRQADSRFFVTHDEPIAVGSAEPAELQRATQAIAAALERTISAAPEQWYSFKPMWPPTAEESAQLAARAARAHGGTAGGAAPAPAS